MRYLIITILTFSAYISSSQGCSDAGFCTMGAMKPDQSYNKRINFKLRAFELNYYRGQSLKTPVITVTTADLTFGINEHYSVQVKIPYQMVSGRLGNTQGVGDFSISASRTIPLKNGYNLGITLGGKLPSGKSDIKTNNPLGSGDLPMYYQVSLGTYDAVAGASIINEKWLFATGIQMPLYQQNHNDFRWGKWTDFPDQDYVRGYNLANNLKRGTDVMLRAERNFRFINFNFGVGALAIYRVTKDNVYNFNTDKREDLKGTTGLASNLLVNFGYNFNVNNSFKIIYGQKITHRKVNPDGLTRKNVMSVSYVYRF